MENRREKAVLHSSSQWSKPGKTGRVPEGKDCIAEEERERKVKTPKKQIKRMNKIFPKVKDLG